MQEMGLARKDALSPGPGAYKDKPKSRNKATRFDRDNKSCDSYIPKGNFSYKSKFYNGENPSTKKAAAYSMVFKPKPLPEFKRPGPGA